MWKDCVNTQPEFSQIFSTVCLNVILSTQKNVIQKKWIFQIARSISPHLKADYSSDPKRFWGK